MIDTHAHLSKRFCDAVGEVAESTKTENIKVILAASNISESKDNIDLAKKYPWFFAAIGIHPQNTDPTINKTIDEQLDCLDGLANSNIDIVKAIGECGLDYSPAPPEEKDRTKEEQETLFRGQIDLAIKYRLPLIIHARKAVDEVIEILKDYSSLKGVFHCYAGGKKRIQQILDLGKEWYFGIDGNLTYEVGLEEVVKLIPKERLILETDSPFLTPVPFRGEINNPNNVVYVYKRVAEIWNKELEEAEKIIDTNAKNLFQLV